MTFRVFRLGLLSLAMVSLTACDSGSSSTRRADDANEAPTISQIFTTPAVIQAGQAQDAVVTVVANDVNADELTFDWVQLDNGPAVNLRDVNQPSVRFAVPDVADLQPDNTIQLQVTVSDGQSSVFRSVLVVIQDPDAGSFTVSAAASTVAANTGQIVTLRGATEPVSTDFSFAWVQTQGPTVSISNAASAEASFEAPRFDPAGNLIVESVDLRFRLTVTDADNNTVGTDNVVVRVLPLPIEAGPTALYVALNGQNSATQIVRMTESVAGTLDYSQQKIFNSIDNEGLVIDINGNAHHVGDHADQDFGGVSTICKIASRAPGASFDDGTTTSRDRDIRGIPASAPAPFGQDSNRSGLGIPGAKGATLAHRAGRLIVANNPGQNVKVFSTLAEGDVAALATITLGANPWDVAYDEARDILYVAATNGRIIILDNFLAQGDNASETRILRLVNDLGQPIADNLHGIAYEPVGDRLIVSDVGPDTTANGSGGNFDGDGSLYVLRDVSELNGDVDSASIIRGAATQLGDPVDIAINGRDVIVAEKANNRVLVFNDIFTRAGGNDAPDRVLSSGLEAPESVAIEFLDLPSAPSVSDLNDASALDSLLLAVSGSAPAIVRANPVLGAQALQGQFTLPTDASDEFRMSMTRSGDAIVMGHAPAEGLFGSDAGYIYEVNRLAYSRTQAGSGQAFTAGIDRVVSSDDGALAAPGGFDIDEDAGLIYAADTDGSDLQIHVYSLCGTDEPIATVTYDDSGVPAASSASTGVHVDFDPQSGDLYVAMSNGRLAVFRDFNVRFGDNPDPQVVSLERINSITNLGESAADSLSGVEYIAAGDRLVLSGIGKISDTATSGQIYILENVANLGSTRLVDVFINGASSGLSNPVDVAFDGADLFVLEQSSNQILRFDNLLSINDGANLTPSASASLANVAGTVTDIMLVPDYLATVPGLTPAP